LEGVISQWLFLKPLFGKTSSVSFFASVLVASTFYFDTIKLVLNSSLRAWCITACVNLNS